MVYVTCGCASYSKRYYVFLFYIFTLCGHLIWSVLQMNEPLLRKCQLEGRKENKHSLPYARRGGCFNSAYAPDSCSTLQPSYHFLSGLNFKFSAKESVRPEKETISMTLIKQSLFRLPISLLLPNLGFQRATPHLFVGKDWG